MAAIMSEGDVVREATRQLAYLLPEGWFAKASARQDPDASAAADALLEVRAPNGDAVTVPIEAKRTVEGRDVASIVERARAAGGDRIVVARYLPATVRERLTDAGLSWADATGNMRVSLAEPGLFVANRGADRDPWRGPGRARGTLTGEPAAKVVRALLDVDREWPMRELVTVSRASTGATYRVVDFLEQEGFIERINRRVVVRDWESILRRWSVDYGFVRNNVTTRWIAPRGVEEVLARARETPATMRYAVTSTLAAARWAPYAPARSAMIYVDSAAAAAAAWGLRETDAGVNVVLAQPAFDAVFERAGRWNGVVMAAASQVAVDLLTGPGRNPAEAEELIEWMKRNEPAWRQ